jgi:hypothetical protein
MAKKKEATVTTTDQASVDKTLTELMSKRADTANFEVWLVGDTPLITHSWSKKAKDEMLAKQVKAVSGGKEARDPDEDFQNSLYHMGDGSYGFPVTGIKNAVLDAAHKDKGLPRTQLMKSLFMTADMVRVAPAKAGAICDLPLVKIWGTEPEMREDMVRIGGITKKSTLAYRAQFTVWACRVKVKLNVSMVPVVSFLQLVMDAGESAGIGEWRNERRGIFGAFHIASPEEAKAWGEYADGKGPMPETATSDAYAMAHAAYGEAAE